MDYGIKMNYALRTRGLQFNILVYIILGILLIGVIAALALTTEGLFEGFFDLMKELILSG